MTEVNLSAQVVEFFGQLAPEPRKSLRLALRRLEQEKGDIKSLEGKLTGYQRLRSGSHRVIIARKVCNGSPEIDCIFAEHRSLVYEVFTAALALQKHPGEYRNQPLAKLLPAAQKKSTEPDPALSFGLPPEDIPVMTNQAIDRAIYG